MESEDAGQLALVFYLRGGVGPRGSCLGGGPHPQGGVACREVLACKQEVALGKGAVCKEELSLKEEIAWEKGYVFRSR